MQREVGQGPKYGSRIRVVFGASEGTHKNYGIEPPTFRDPLRPVRAASLGNRPVLLGHFRPTSGAICVLSGRLFGAWMGLRPFIHADRPPGPSVILLGAAPWGILGTRRLSRELRPCSDPPCRPSGSSSVGLSWAAAVLCRNPSSRAGRLSRPLWDLEPYPH